MIEVSLFTLFGLLLGALVWWTWTQREHARRQIEMNAQLTLMGKEVKAIAHDVTNLFAIMLPNLKLAKGASSEDLPEMIEDIERAAESAEGMVAALHGRSARASTEAVSAEGVVRVVLALLKSRGVPLHLRVDGELLYRGADADALRVVQNLIFNAMREAARIEGGEVRIELSPGTLRVVNPVRDPSTLDARIYERGVSFNQSSGLGLAIAREAAQRIGWGLRHEVLGRDVAFVVEGRA